MTKALEIVLTFQSSHDAIAAERVLLENNISVRTMPLPSHIAEGCGICLRIWEYDYSCADIVLADAGIVPKGVWLKQKDGFFIKF